MTALNFKTIVIGLASLLMTSVAQGKCYPGLDCPDDLPNAANQSVPAPSTNQQVPESSPEPAPAESQVQPEEQSITETGGIVGRVKTEESNDAPEASDAPVKYKKHTKYQN
jgi:hypothetical protein